MLKSLRHGAGYLQIDHRDSPGLTADDVAHVPGAIAAPGGTVTERDVKQCSHCQRAVVLHPLRVRDRGFCPKCNSYVCDACEDIRVRTGECVPFVKVLDTAQNIAEKFVGQPDHPDAQAPLVTLT
jgi:hypothetical protein